MKPTNLLTEFSQEDHGVESYPKSLEQQRLRQRQDRGQIPIYRVWWGGKLLSKTGYTASNPYTEISDSPESFDDDDREKSSDVIITENGKARVKKTKPSV